MLIDLLRHHPEALGAIVRGTPAWVWGLLAALLALGASQLRERTASLARVTLMPLAMAGFSAWGTASAFGSSPLLPQVLAVWAGMAAGVTALVAPGAAPAHYDPAARTYRLPGSAVPLLLIATVFLLKWGVGVELALAPQRTGEPAFALAVAAAYGVTAGLFAGRAARLWALAHRTHRALA